MNRLIYPLVASAMITILPFLLTFEKGQNIVRGLFGYETLGLLLLFIWFKKNVGQKTDRLFFKGLWSAGTVITGIIMIFVAWLDLLDRKSVV